MIILVFSSVADNINIVTGGSDRVSISTTRMSLGFPLYIPNGSSSAPSLSFSTYSANNTGLFRVSEDSLGISTNGTLRFNVTTSAVACSLPLTLPTTGGTGLNLDHYEKRTHSTTFTYENKTSAYTTITIRRVGKILSIFIPYLDNSTNNNGLNVSSFSNTALLSRFRPQNNTIFSINIQNNAVFNFKVCLIKTGSVVEILDVNQGRFGNNTRLETYASSVTFFVNFLVKYLVNIVIINDRKHSRFR